jgi:DNA-binding LacI/PurR family transcriptional regulator
LEHTTIIKIAEKLDIYTLTLLRALNNHSYKKQKTRDQIKQFAELKLPKSGCKKF